MADTVGLGGSAGATSEEIFWAVRRLFETLARSRPLVVVIDDLQWAEPTFLDLVEHVAELARDAPIVLLCMARPELLEARPGWGGGKLNAASILLEPLGADESRQLVENLLSYASPSGEAAARIADACEGNPLFAEELLAMLIDDGLLRREDERWVLVDELAELPVPPTIHALLAARLERLPEEERALLARVSVEGTVFHREVMRELAPEALAPLVDRSLTALVRKDVIRPDRSSFADDDAFRFRHMLIRDAAYRSLPKEVRADLHARFAEWLEDVGGSRLSEFEEIVGYHLEQAHRCLAELGPLDADAEALGRRGSERLEAVGRRALARGDLAAAVRLLERAAALVPDDSARRAVAAAGSRGGADRDGQAGRGGRRARGSRPGGQRQQGTRSPRRACWCSKSSCDCSAARPRATPRRRRWSNRSPRSSARRRRARALRSAAARRVAALDRGAGRRGRSILGTGRRTRAERGGRARTDRDPGLDRLVALLRPDAT